MDNTTVQSGSDCWQRHKRGIKTKHLHMGYTPSITQCSRIWHGFHGSLDYRTLLFTSHLVFILVMQPVQAVPDSQPHSFYPPFFNAALHKPVTISPEDNTCGLLGPQTFCRGLADPSVMTCREEVCDASCPNRVAPGTTHDMLETSNIQDWKSGCTWWNSTTVAPYPAEGTQALQFGRGGEHCFLEVDYHKIVVGLVLMGRWNVTFTAWIYPDPDLSHTQTLMDIRAPNGSILKLTLRGEQVWLHSYNATMTNTRWLLQGNTWQHLAIQIYDSTVSVFVGGYSVYPSMDFPSLARPGYTRAIILGNTLTPNSEFFRGFIQNFDVHIFTMSNREIESLVTGHFQVVGAQSDCRCPGSHPRINPDDNTYCSHNDGPARDVTQEFRLNDRGHLVSFVNDGKYEDTYWLSAYGVNSTNITIQLGEMFEVRHVTVLMYSHVPTTLAVYRRVTSSADWQLWQVYSADCLEHAGIPPDRPLTSESDVRCTDLNGLNLPLTKSELKLDILDNRPGISHGDMSIQLRQFMRAESVLISLDGISVTMQAEGHRYHAVYEIIVNATCDCHAHGQKCDRSQMPYICSCAPESYTEGDRCDQCTQNAYRLSDNVYAPDFCMPCDCHTSGTAQGDDTCEKIEGQCSCKSKVTGRSCDKCVDGFFNLTASNPAGCQTCECDTEGTVSGSNTCDIFSGRCDCKANVKGLLCDVCKPGTYGLDGEVKDGCLDCNCELDGTIGRRDTCGSVDGQCQCKSSVTGRSCNTCIDGTYNLTDNNVAGCTPCHCDPDGAVSQSCHSTSGQCYCRLHVIGWSCDQCERGYFALDAGDFSENGCAHTCDCGSTGTEPGEQEACAPVGGQCACLGQITGRRCDACPENMYGLGQGCTECGCDTRGVREARLDCTDDGQCTCKENVHGLRCTSCSPGHFGLASRNPEGCQLCGCYPRGSVTNTSCDVISGQCLCNPDAGDVAKGGRTCNAYVLSLSPTYGPESGGTRISVGGGYFGDDLNGTVINLGDISCLINLEESSSRELVCLTSSPNASDRLHVVDQQLQVWITLPDQTTLSVTQTFVLRKDPIINDIHPMRTFLGGGIDLTVTGDYLDSVAAPKIQVILDYKNTDDTRKELVFQDNCTVSSATSMLCPTPAVTLPGDVTRSQRSLEEPIHTPQGRHRRAANNDQQEIMKERLNGLDTQFYLGFKLDGVTEYRNLSEAPGHFAPLSMFHNPVFEMFEESVRVFRPYWPYDHEALEISGDRLNYGCTGDDYRILIGRDECRHILLTTNSIRCIPPVDPPPHGDTGHKHGAPAVLISVGNINFIPGYFKYEINFWDNITFRYGLIGAVAGLLILILILVLICCLCCGNRKRKEPRDDVVDLDISSGFDKLEMRPGKTGDNGYITAYSESGSYDSTYLTPATSPDLLSLLSDDIKCKVESHLVSGSRVTLGRMIGQGQYGRVHLGHLADEGNNCHIPVAVKKLKEDRLTLKDTEQFLEEATLMSDFKHTHLLGLLGVVLDGVNMVYVVVPYMDKGDLKKFITNEENVLTVGELISFGLQIASGMRYLEDHKFVHRDLACRNCMINQSMLVKVADFGLSRDIYQSDYYQEHDRNRPMPVKWMALESLETGIFSTKSDVWSFGVVMWELLTRGCPPYPDVDVLDVKSYLISGQRMDRPDYAPDEIFALILECWKSVPSRRPSFLDIHERMTDFLNMSDAKTIQRKRQSQRVPSKGASYY